MELFPLMEAMVLPEALISIPEVEEEEAFM